MTESLTNSNAPCSIRRARGFVLLEVMLAVAIFSIGILALGACVSNCLVAERVKEEDARAARALANRMAEIEAGSVVLTDSSTEELKGMCEGMTLKTTRVPLNRKNEKNEELTDLYAVTLELSWESDRQKQSRELIFYFYAKPK